MAPIHSSQASPDASGVSGVPLAYDPFVPAVVADPYSWYRSLREEAPCAYLPDRDLYVVTRYDDVRAVLRHPEIFSSRDGPAYRPVLDRSVLIDRDPPLHTQQRRAVAAHFTLRSIEKLRPRITALVAELVDPLVDVGPVDLTRKVADRLPIRVIADWVGLPRDHEADYQRFAEAYFATWTLSDDAGMEDVRPILAEGLSFFADVIRHRRGHATTDGLLGALLFPPEGRTGLNDGELAYFCYALITAGTETTRNLIGNATLAAIRHPGQWDQVVRARERLVDFIEETLRYDSPAQGVFRTTTETVEIADTRIPTRSRILALLASANRDPSQFTHPDSFLIDRRFDVPALSFGAGIHTCIGAALSRLEANAFFQALLDRGVTIEAAGEPLRTTHPMLRGVDALPVVLRPTKRSRSGPR